MLDSTGNTKATYQYLESNEEKSYIFTPSVSGEYRMEIRGVDSWKKSFGKVKIHLREVVQ